MESAASVAMPWPQSSYFLLRQRPQYRYPFYAQYVAVYTTALHIRFKYSTWTNAILYSRKTTHIIEISSNKSVINTDRDLIVHPLVFSSSNPAICK
jgi:hypothetical protein